MEYRVFVTSDCDLSLWVSGRCVCNNCTHYRLQNGIAIPTDTNSIQYERMLTENLHNTDVVYGPIESFEHLADRMLEQIELRWNIELDIRNHIFFSLMERSQGEVFASDIRQAELISFEEAQPEKQKLPIQVVLVDDVEDVQSNDNNIVPVVLSPASPANFCAICLNTSDTSPFVNFLHVCQHSFHQLCLQHAVQTKAECPVCKCTLQSRKKAKKNDTLAENIKTT